jgi:hypothetical protein
VINDEATSGRWRRHSWVLLAGVLVTVVAGCGGSKGGSSKSSESPPKTTVSSGVSTGAAAAVTTSYIRFFDPTVAESDRLGLIQHGTAFSQAIDQEAKSAFAKAATVKVITVTVNSAKRATVVYTILLSGSPVLSNQTGYAVNEGGKWKVAGQTFCELLQVQGPLPPVCKMKSATALPS